MYIKLFTCIGLYYAHGGTIEFYISFLGPISTLRMIELKRARRSGMRCHLLLWTIVIPRSLGIRIMSG